MSEAARRRLCPDTGTCHHDCPLDACFRVHNCGPFTDVYPDDDWPTLIVAKFRDAPPSIEHVIIGRIAP